MLFIQLFLTNRPAGDSLPAAPWFFRAANQHFMFSDTSFSFISTKIISFPTWQISQKGIMYSFSLPRKPQMHPGPGTMRASMQPVSISKSTSPTKPRRLQVFTLMTSFCLRSYILVALTSGCFLLLIYAAGNAFRHHSLLKRIGKQSKYLKPNDENDNDDIQHNAHNGQYHTCFCLAVQNTVTPGNDGEYNA